MNFSFENLGTNTYLVYAIKPEDSVDTMSLGMLTNNNILGLAPTQYTQMDTAKYIKYNISAHISVKQFFSGPVNKKRLIGVFKGIVNAMLSAEDYMIDTNSIVLDLDYIFADVSTCETVLICLPISNCEQSNMDLGMFFKNIVFSTQFDQTENCDHVAKIMNYLNSSPLFSLTDFKNVLDEIEKGELVNNQTVPQPTPVVKATSHIVQPVANQDKKVTPIAPVQTSVNVTSEKVVPEKPQPKVPFIQKPVNVPQTQKNIGEMAIPNSASTPVKETPKNNEAETEEKMSMFYLLQHYNKENAAIYKAQQEAKKNQKGVANKPTKVKEQKKSTAAPVGFDVPGAPNTNNNFAIPGQQTPPPAAIPHGNPVAIQFKTPVSNVPQQQPVQNSPQTTVAKPVSNIPQQPYQVPQGKPMNFGETTVLGGGGIGETTVLGAAPTAIQPKPHLIRAKNNEKINLDKPVFRIGKEKSYVDYFIGDNTAISRSHANFISRDGEYFVTDTNSTNHTYLNGTMIQSNIEVKLTHGDKVRLANEDFEFKLY